jgi:hypothetical protein
LNRIIRVILLVVILASGCATAPQSAARSDFEKLCRSLGAQDGKVSKEELLAAVQDKAQAEKIFDLCDANKDAFLTVEEAERRDWAIRQLLRLTPAPKLAPPPAGRK